MLSSMQRLQERPAYPAARPSGDETSGLGQLVRVVLACALVLLIESCGGGGNGNEAGAARCPSDTVCGGNFVPGTYEVASTCANYMVPTWSLSCPNGTITVTGAEVTGTYTFSSDGTYVASSTVVDHWSSFFPADCKTSSGANLTCAQYQQQIQNSPSSTAATVRCAGYPDCTCAIVSKPAPVRDTGTYTISGGQLLMNSSVKGFVIGTTFCISGNELALQSDSIDLGDFTVPGTMILSMQ